MTTKKKADEQDFYSAESVHNELGIALPPTFGALIKTWRKCDGLTQPELAKKLGISKQLLSAYERGTQLPTLKTGIALAQDIGLFLPQAIQALLDDQLKQASVTEYSVKLVKNVS